MSLNLVRINLPLFSTILPSNSCCFCPVGLSLLIHFQLVLWVLKLLLSPDLGSWQLDFKSLIIVIGFFFFFFYLAWAVDLGVQITDEGRSLYIGSFCPAMRSLEEAAFSISISSSVFIFLWLFSICIMDMVSSIVFIAFPSFKEHRKDFR